MMYKQPVLENRFNSSPQHDTHQIEELRNYFLSFVNKPTGSAIVDLLSATLTFVLSTDADVNRKRMTDDNLKIIISSIGEAIDNAKRPIAGATPLEQQIHTSANRYVHDVIQKRHRELTAWHDPLIKFWNNSSLPKWTGPQNQR